MVNSCCGTFVCIVQSRIIQIFQIKYKSTGTSSDVFFIYFVTSYKKLFILSKPTLMGIVHIWIGYGRNKCWTIFICNIYNIDFFVSTKSSHQNLMSLIIWIWTVI